MYTRNLQLCFLARIPQETTRLTGEATSNVTIFTNWCCTCVARPIQGCFSKHSDIFFLKLGTLDKQVIDTGREFKILGPWQRIVK